MTRALPLALALVAGVLAGPSAGGEERERLERIRAEIEEREARARELGQEAKGHLGELEALDRGLAETRRSLDRLRRSEAAALGELESAEEELVAAEAARARIEADLVRRLVARYKFRSTGGRPALTSAREFQAAAQLDWGLGRILEADRLLFARYREAAGALGRSRDRKGALLEEIEAARAEIERREERTRVQLVERRNLVALLRSRADRERRTAGELREAAERLEEALRTLPQGREPAGDGLRKGRVPRPVRGTVRVGFGRHVDPVHGTATLRTGVEIEAPRGTPVRAVAAGRVLFAGWFRGYGQMVILDHGRGSMTVSGYLDELTVEADAEVPAGHVIGSLGDTGSLGGPALYFEIRRDGVAVDPEAWLE